MTVNFEHAVSIDIAAAIFLAETNAFASFLQERQLMELIFMLVK